MREVAARDFTLDEAREFVDHVRASVEDLKDWIIRAVKGRAWLALGYASWDEMCEAEFDGAVIRLPREERREAVASLREAGLSTRAIGSALGVADQTVRADLGRVRDFTQTPETVTSLDGRERPATQARRDPGPEPEPEPQGPERGDKRPEPGIWYGGPAEPQRPKRSLMDALEERMPGSKAEVRASHIRARLSKAAAGCADIVLIPTSDARDALTADEIDTAAWQVERAAEWIAALKKARSGLRVVGGAE